MDPERREIRRGFVAVNGNRIAAVGPMEECSFDHPGERINASGCAVVPGFVNTHTHAVYNLLRGGISDDRPLYDWLLNVVHPGLGALTPTSASAAASLFCLESIRAGITTFVDNADSARFDDVAEATMSTYEAFGVRAIYARMFADLIPEEFQAYADAVVAKEPDVNHYLDSIEQTPQALEHIDQMMLTHRGRADGRITVWPAPGVAKFTTRAGLLGSKEVARKHGTMLTIHIAESSFDRDQAGMTSIAYLDAIGFLGPEVLANHCVQADEQDVRILASSGTRVSHNPVSNLFLASGIAPIADMARSGVRLSLGTDDPNCNSSVNILADMKVAALAQKVRSGDAAALSADRLLEMATIEGAAAIGMEGEIGSIEVGKKADIVTVDLQQPQMLPISSISSVLVYQALGSEVQDVVVDGRLLMRGRVVRIPGDELEGALLARAQRASDEVIERAGLDVIRRRFGLREGPNERAS